MMLTPTSVLLGLLIGILLLAAYFDVRFRRLPNWLTLVTMLIGLGHLYAFSGSFEQVGSGLLHAVIALVVGMLLFRAAMVGGGDAKYYAAVAAGIPLTGGVKLLVLTAVSGLFAVVLWFIVRRSLGKTVTAGDKNDFAKFPLGVAISLGSLAYWTTWV